METIEVVALVVLSFASGMFLGMDLALTLTVKRKSKEIQAYEDLYK